MSFYPHDKRGDLLYFLTRSREAVVHPELLYELE